MSVQPTLGPDSDSELARGLRNLGLTEYEVRVYLAVLRYPMSRVPEIARRSEVPQAKVYATIKRLIGRGLCESHLGPVNTYGALPPHLALGPLLEKLHTQAGEAAEAVQRLEQEHREPAPALGPREGRIKVFQGRQAIQRNYRELVSGAASEMVIATRPPLLIRDDDDVLSAALGRGVSVRFLVEAPQGFDFEGDDVYRRQVELGCQARSLERVPMRMGVFDRRVSLLPLQEPGAAEKNAMVLEARNVSLSSNLMEIFELLWDQGAPLPF